MIFRRVQRSIGAIDQSTGTQHRIDCCCVDAGDPAPMRLYLSAGFHVVSGVEAWDKRLD